MLLAGLPAVAAHQAIALQTCCSAWGSKRRLSPLRPNSPPPLLSKDLQMDVAVLSDLHIDIERNAWRDPPTLDVDALVVIGDTTNPMTRGLPWIAETFA